MSTNKVDRPLGVALLSVLGIIIGILAILFGGLITITGFFFIDAIEAALSQYSFPGITIGLILSIWTIIGIIILIIGVLDIVLGWGLWNRKEWARIITIILSIVGIIVLGLIPLVSLDFSGLIFVIIYIIIIYYLTRSFVVNFFKTPIE